MLSKGLDIEKFYGEQINKSLQTNPTQYLKTLLIKNGKKFDPTDILMIFDEVGKVWSKIKKFGFNIGFVIEEEKEFIEAKNLNEYDFNDDFVRLLTNSEVNSIIYRLDKNGHIVDPTFKKDKLESHLFIMNTEESNCIGFLCGKLAVELIVCGTMYPSENYRDYFEGTKYKPTRNIRDFKNILNDFYVSEIAKTNGSFLFARMENLCEKGRDTLKNHSKLLVNKPERLIQERLKHYLDYHVDGIVLKEVTNDSNDRYDIWVINHDSLQYMFELKWLGISVTPTGNPFSKYDSDERALEGARQLMHYMETSEYSFSDGNHYNINCGVLVVYDARLSCRKVEKVNEIIESDPRTFYEHFNIEKKSNASLA